MFRKYIFLLILFMSSCCGERFSPAYTTYKTLAFESDLSVSLLYDHTPLFLSFNGTPINDERIVVDGYYSGLTVGLVEYSNIYLSLFTAGGSTRPQLCESYPFHVCWDLTEDSIFRYSTNCPYEISSSRECVNTLEMDATFTRNTELTYESTLDFRIVGSILMEESQNYHPARMEEFCE